jgi:hypothetical protein
MTLRDAHRPAAPAELRNDQRQARELQERVILLALQWDVGQDHPHGRWRCASHVMALRPPVAEQPVSASASSRSAGTRSLRVRPSGWRA